MQYRTEKNFKNKLIKNFTYFDLGKKSEFKCSPRRASNVKLYFNFPFNYHKEDNLAAAELNLFLYNVMRACKLKKVPQ